MQITSKTMGWLIGLIAVGTVSNVWVFLTPAVATVAQEQRSLTDDVRYLRDRMDEVHEAVGAHRGTPAGARKRTKQ